ncbi:3D-(3,5/4)-trihydroxycyclohexane-1,2-dione acylhydrolase (decyclizing) [Virgibacillus pantothenticus]|nr:3D-(3,5/4)-trihydroxycyclohexane-1,2-dione acylhydrolase (decyclizing) [Virgibacillus pantothenticus]MBU8602481.1 3D-(3,5/4)-trihydroxycyclohexane-1,2-dione acylhydrolase (decyclizing) [Virgibacillus pantothenticus]MBU8636664.1 3D-(3,5/4)-trihydroxycyclohexane-1,2-dione acylhydrolase (decyclizing) [Virgibacillus pantothenticus]MBU8644358.1 3D-(3,5/4)-trihydroxycyclohexane-1,2-dione acylhydrolase (decyclizing) [Virgibacillus pantothenticus]MBU8648482.1 3D-(3,5/4)-trihydroxycyclohexane-1,2-dio
MQILAEQLEGKNKTIRLTMAQALVKFLDNQYVDLDGEERKFFQGIFGIFGHGNATGLAEALEMENTKLTYIQGKNEQGMVHVATAYAKQKNRLETYACATSIGPGALNMVTAAGTATVNRIPVLLLPSDNFATRQPDPVLQQIEDPTDYTISATDAFKPVSRYWDRITRPEQLMTAALNAMRVLTDPADTGAVTLALPQDVQAEAYDYPVSFFKKRVHLIERRTPSEEALKRAVDLMLRKKKPLIVAGGGAHYSFATDILRKFAETFQIPISETQAGKSAISWKHPLSMGGMGANGSKASNILAKDADLIIAVGTRLTDFSTSSKLAFQHPNVEFLNINVSAFDAMKMDSQMLVSDAKTALTLLLEALSEHNYFTSYQKEELQLLKEGWDSEVNRLYALESEDGLEQSQVIGILNQWLDEKDIITCAAGSLPGDLLKLWRSTYPKTYHMEYGFSTMGYEVQGALGIKLAEPDREVYALVGDGSYFMLHSELVTSIQENKKINIILFDNHGFQCIHGLQVGQGSEGFGNEFRYREETTNQLSGEYMQFDFALHARSLGANGYTANTVEELREALQQARQNKKSTLIHIRTLPSKVPGYESWWRLGVAEVTKSDKVKAAYHSMEEKLSQARKY